MDFTTTAIGLFSLFQTTLGFLGNLALLFHSTLSEFTGIKARPTDLIVKHLTWANLMVLLCKGISHSMTAFGQIYFLDDIACKLVFYFHRVARGVSLGSTYLLSIFQAIMISPRSQKWAQLKARVPEVIGSSLGLCWALQLTLNAFVPFFVIARRGERNISEFRNPVYCDVIEPHNLRYTLYKVLLASTDVMCLGLVMWASGSMVFILLKHKQRVRHVQRFQSSSSSSPETRATHSILAPVSSFVLFYVASVFVTLHSSVFNEITSWLVSVSLALGTCFSAFCPFLLMRHYFTVCVVCSTSSYQKTDCPSAVRGK